MTPLPNTETNDIPNGGIKFHLPISLLDDSSEGQNSPHVSMEYAKGWNDCLKIVRENLEDNPKVELVWFKEQLTNTTEEG